MKKWIPFAVCGILLLCLAGCGRENTGREEWYRALDSLKQSTNYTVRQITSVGWEQTTRVHRYTQEAAMLDDPEGTTYFAREDGVCYGLVYNALPPIWLRQQLQESRNYFYDYEMVERLNRLTAYVDQGILDYDAQAQTYSGENLEQTYVFRQQEHRITQLVLRLENGRIAEIREEYIADGIRHSDRVWLEDFAVTAVELPLNVLDLPEGFEEAAKK